MKTLLKNSVGFACLTTVMAGAGGASAQTNPIDRIDDPERGRRVDLVERLRENRNVRELEARDLAFRRTPSLGAEEALAAVEEHRSAGQYLAGDKHNHTTCSDGSTSPKVLADQSLVAFGLDWFGMVGHGGAGTRDCRFTDADYQSLTGGPVRNRINGYDNGALWVDTIGEDDILGDEALTTSRVARARLDDAGNAIPDDQVPDREQVQAMWRWQSIRDFQYQDVMLSGIVADKPAFTGLEWVVPGHEHSSAAVIEGQFPFRRNEELGSAFAMAQFEYLWDRADNDFTGGAAAGFEDPANRGVPKEENVAGDHGKSVRAVEWMREFYPATSFAIAAHVERQGGFVPDENRGYNVEHLRDWHNAGLLAEDPEAYSISFGMEGQAGHQAGSDRGTYSARRPSAGLYTYGGTGAYSAAEVTLPGRDFDGNPLTLETAVALGLPEDEFTDNPIERIVLARPGLATLWDSLLGEGRRFFHVGSSDWHNRGTYGPFEPSTTLDFWPGEYQKMYSFVPNDDVEQKPAEAVIQGLRAGNTYTVMGDLIGDDFTFVACYSVTGECVTMGQKLEVEDGEGEITYAVSLIDPEGVNNSPYFFDNPSLLQIGVNQPLNAPVLDHIDVVVGDVTGFIEPDDAAYETNNRNESTRLFETFDDDSWTRTEDGRISFSWTVQVADLDADQYVRLRGTNMPQGVPNETDVDGNPLSDNLASNIVCPFGPTATEDRRGDDSDPVDQANFDPLSCPEHLPENENGEKVISFDVEAWTDLWFYANPIFIDIQSDDSSRFASR